MRNRFRAWVFTIALFATSCNPDLKSLSAIQGHYQGTMIRRTASGLTKVGVETDLVLNADRMNAVLKDASGAVVLQLRLLQDATSAIRLELLGSNDEATSRVSMRWDSGALKGESGSRYLLSGEPDFSHPSTLRLEVNAPDGAPSLSVALTPASASAPTTLLEAPAAYTFDQSMDRAFHRNFDTLIEFQHTVQARYTAQGAYKNLLPHLSMGSVLSGASGGILGFFGAMGDFVPFLLPNRWLAAKEAGLRSQAERYALTAMRLDAGVQVEGLIYALESSKSVLHRYDGVMSRAATVGRQIELREDLGQLPRGASDDIKSVLNLMAQDRAGLDRAKDETLEALSLSMGFVSPEAVSDVTQVVFGSSPDLAHELEKDPIFRQALAQSVEIRQMDELIAAAQVAVQERYFTWLDPAADPALGLGFGLGDQIRVARSQVEELRLRRTDLEAMLMQRTNEAVEDYNRALAAWRLAHDGEVIQDRRLNRMLTAVEFGTSTDLFELVLVFQDYLKAGLSVDAAVLQFRGANARIDRMTGQGRYAHVDGDPAP